MSRDFQRQFRQQLVEQGKIDFTAGEDAPVASSVTSPLSIGKQSSLMVPQRVAVSEHAWMQNAYDDTALADYVPPKKEFNGSVLPTKLSTLVGCIVDETNQKVVTIDSDRLIREWRLYGQQGGECVRSYLLETREDQIAEAN